MDEILNKYLDYSYSLDGGCIASFKSCVSLKERKEVSRTLLSNSNKVTEIELNLAYSVIEPKRVKLEGKEKKAFQKERKRKKKLKKSGR